MTCQRAPIVFDVYGTPRPKARPRVGARGAVTPKATRDWQQVVAAYAACAGVRPITGPVKLEVWLDRALTGDGDNYVKSIADALNGVAYADDSQVVEWAVHMVGLDQIPGRADGVRCRILVCPYALADQTPAPPTTTRP